MTGTTARFSRAGANGLAGASRCFTPKEAVRGCGLQAPGPFDGTGEARSRLAGLVPTRDLVVAG